MSSKEHQTQMTIIEAIVTNLLTEIDRIVDQKVETKLPEMIRALGIRETNPEEEDLIDAVEVRKNARTRRLHKT
jgi:hypothetical protein